MVSHQSGNLGEEYRLGCSSHRSPPFFYLTSRDIQNTD
ncbi:predicted protein [Botrytis cinerea T4]|uniref:Uncharacterized protein n=1 Tax=Botryotinia fuckeliana (strain T4) TaxID=999810 RepID=G2Y2U3_BOTF4|nr:predicted protein [Botrytis cinerea T4]